MITVGDAEAVAAELLIPPLSHQLLRNRANKREIVVRDDTSDLLTGTLRGLALCVPPSRQRGWWG